MSCGNLLEREIRALTNSRKKRLDRELVLYITITLDFGSEFGRARSEGKAELSGLQDIDI